MFFFNVTESCVSYRHIYNGYITLKTSLVL